MKTKSNLSLRDKYGKRVSFLVYGTKDHLFSYIFKLLFNCIKSIYLYFKIHPDYIITTGTHTAGPICYFGKIFGSRVIYIETFANITTKTITGKLIYPIADSLLFPGTGQPMPSIGLRSPCRGPQNPPASAAAG